MKAKPKKTSTALTVAGPNLKHMGSVNPEGKPETSRHGAFDEPPKTPKERDKDAEEYLGRTDGGYLDKTTRKWDRFRGILAAYRAGDKVAPKVDTRVKAPGKVI